MNQIATLWVGDSLGPVERACVRSMLRQGHDVALYTYGNVAGVPEGVEVRDAEPILARSAIPDSWSRRSDLYSDWFRYLIQKHGLGTWLDLDMYLVAPLDTTKEYLFGEYEPGKINGAVLRLPANAPILTPLLDQYQKGISIRSLPILTRPEALYRKMTMGISHIAKSPFGTTGPYALTLYVPRFGLTAEADPVEVFHPIPEQIANWILDPSQRLEELITERTVGVHLWNEYIRHYKHSDPPPGSFLERLHDEGRV